MTRHRVLKGVEVGDIEFVENESSKMKGEYIGEDVPKIVETPWEGQWLAGCSMYDVDDERGEVGKPEIRKRGGAFVYIPDLKGILMM